MGLFTDEERLTAIEARNTRVEQDKAWETSWTRRLAIGLLTYLVVLCTLVLIGAQNPYLGSLVPVLGFLLSTLSLPVLRNIWARSIEKRK